VEKQPIYVENISVYIYITPFYNCTIIIIYYIFIAFIFVNCSITFELLEIMCAWLMCVQVVYMAGCCSGLIVSVWPVWVEKL